ncbi:hypothetical protein ACVIIW_007176 [Bradyrhizobium sp. USDA 4449]
MTQALAHRGVAPDEIDRLTHTAQGTPGAEMLNFIEVFDAMEVDPNSVKAVWMGLTGTRTALRRDGFTIDPNIAAYCPTDWLDERGYLDAELARKHPRPWRI